MDEVRWSDPREGWRIRDALLAILFVAAAVAVASDAFIDIARLAWLDEEASHVLLVPAAVVAIVWVRRASLRACRRQGQWIGPVIMLLGTAGWWVGRGRDVQSVWHLGAVTMAVGGFLTVYGSNVLRRFWPAFLALVFVVPVPSFGRALIAQPLQSATARATQSVSEVLGLGVLQTGNVLTVNGTQVAVAEACNGMRMVFTLFLVCYLFAYITPLREYVRWTILLCAPLLAIACNVIRLVPTVWAYGHLSPESAALFHDVSGWVMLFLAFAVLQSIVGMLRWLMLPVTPFQVQFS